MKTRERHSSRFTILALVATVTALLFKTFGFRFIEQHFLGEQAWGPLLYLYLAMVAGSCVGLVSAGIALIRRERWPLLSAAAGLLNIAAWISHYLRQ